MWSPEQRQGKLQEQSPSNPPDPGAQGGLVRPGQVGRHLQVSVYDAQAVQIGHSAQDLADQVAGILFRVGATLHDAIKQLTSCHPVGSRDSVAPGPLNPTHRPAPSLPLPFSQLHGQVQVGRALVDILQGHNVGVADPAIARECPYRGQQPPLGSGPRNASSHLWSLPYNRPPMPNPARQSPWPGLPGNTEEAGALPRDTASPLQALSP